MNVDFWTQTFQVIVHFLTIGSLSKDSQDNLIILNGLLLIFIIFPLTLILCWLLHKKKLSGLTVFRIIGFLTVILLTPLFYSSYGWGGGLVSFIIIYTFIKRVYRLAKEKEEEEMRNK